MQQERRVLPVADGRSIHGITVDADQLLASSDQTSKYGVFLNIRDREAALIGLQPDTRQRTSGFGNDDCALLLQLGTGCWRLSIP